MNRIKEVPTFKVGDLVQVTNKTGAEFFMSLVDGRGFGIIQQVLGNNMYEVQLITYANQAWCKTFLTNEFKGNSLRFHPNKQWMRHIQKNLIDEDTSDIVTNWLKSAL